jgi:PAS domain S-box-containing protein
VSFETPAKSREWLCQHIVEDTPEAIIFADRGGRIQVWNSGAEAMFGYRAEEALGQTLDLIIPERLRDRHWEGYRKAMATGTTRYGQDLLKVPGVRKDGTRISLEFSVALLRDETGELLGPVAVIRDVTARWEHDKATKERLAALEAKVQNLGKPSHGSAI